MLGNLFSSQQRSPQSADGVTASATSLTANYEQELTPEAERLLAAVPDTIGETADTNPIPGDVQDTPEPAAALSLSTTITPDAVSDGLQVLTGWIADWRQFEPWRLDEVKADKLATSYAQVLDALWQRYAPIFLTQLSATTPGLLQAAVMSALVFGPVIKADLARNKDKNAARQMVHEGTSHQAPPQPAKPKQAGGMIYDQGGDV